MKRSFVENLLKDLEIEEDVRKNIVNSIMTENGNDINAEKTKTESVQNDLKVKEGLIEELNEKIKEASSVDIEKIKKEQFDLGKEEGSKEFENFKKTTALENALGNFKAKDIKLLEKLLDNEKLSYEEKDGEYSITGLDEQIKGIKTTHSYLFEEEKDNKPGLNLGGEHNGNPPTNNVMDLRSALHEKYDK